MKKNKNVDIENEEKIKSTDEEQIEKDCKEEACSEEEQEEVKNDKEVDKEEKIDEELEKRYLRLMADFSNYKKRAEKEKTEIYSRASARIIVDLLPVIDDFERAISHAKKKQAESEQNTEKESFIGGIEMIFSNMINVLKNDGLEIIDVEDKDFDPNFHNAVAAEEVEGVEQGKVITEIQKGYMINGKVIRHSLVRVSS